MTQQLADKEEGELSSDGDCAEFVGAGNTSTPSLSNAPNSSSAAHLAGKQPRGGAAADRDRAAIGKNSNEKVMNLTPASALEGAQ